MAGLLRQCLLRLEEVEKEKPQTSAGHLAASNVSALTAAKFLIKRTFTSTELDSLCFELNINHEQIQNDVFESKIENLLRHCDHRGRFADLVKLCSIKRPEEPWTAVLELRNKYENKKI